MARPWRGVGQGPARGGGTAVLVMVTLAVLLVSLVGASGAANPAAAVAMQKLESEMAQAWAERPDRSTPSAAQKFVGVQQSPSIGEPLAATAAAVEPSPPPTRDPKEMLTEAKCEAAVADLQSAWAKIDANLIVEQQKLMNATKDKVGAQQLYDDAFNVAAKDQALQFGRDYLALKQQMKELRAREVDDNKYKNLYIKLTKEYPALNGSLTNILSGITLLEQKKQDLAVEKDDLDDKISVAGKENAALQKQWPITRKTLDHKYAGDLIAAKAKSAKLESEWAQRGKKDEEGEKLLLPLADALKSINIKLDDLKRKREIDKTAAKTANSQIVSLTKEMTGNLGVYSDQLDEKHEELMKRNSNEIKTKQRAREEDDAADARAEEALQAQKVQAEEVSEAKIEETEAEDAATNTGNAEEAENTSEQEALETRLQKLKVKTDARIQALESKAARAVEKVKNQYLADLNEVRLANGDKAVVVEVRDPSKERRKVHEMAERLRASIPPEPNSKAEAALEEEKKAKEDGIVQL